jgi:hypothetical protein
METVRLRKIQQPSRVESLLDAYISRGDSLPPGSYEVHERSALPEALRRVAARATQQGRVWRCWASRSHAWLFTADMSLPLSRERGAPVLQVSIHDEHGELTDSGCWMMDRQSNWTRCSD